MVNSPFRVFPPLATLLLLACLPASATLIVYEPFDYGLSSGALATRGGTGTEAGFLATDKWTGGGSYDPTGLAFGNLKTTAGCASNLASTAYRKYNVTQTGTIYGSFLWKPISGGSASTVNGLMLHRTAGGGDTSADIDLATWEYGNGPKCGLRLTGTQSAAPVAGSQNAALGTTYLAVFVVSNLVSSGSATQGITMWIMTTNQFSYRKPLGLSESALNAAVAGTADSNVFERVTMTKAAASARMQAGDYLEMFYYTGPNFSMDEIRFSDTSLDEATPLNLGWSGIGASGVTTNSAEAAATLAGMSADVYLVWDASDKGTGSLAAWAHTNFLGANVTPQPLSATMSDLSPGTSYAFRFYATNTTSGAAIWSSPGTVATRGPPVVNHGTGPAPGLGYAVLNGQLVSTGGVPTDVYIYWGTDPNNWTGTNYLGSKSAGSFSTTVSNLYYGLPYQYRCFATNQYGGVWASAATNFFTSFPVVGLGTPGLVARSYGVTGKTWLDPIANLLGQTAAGTTTQTSDLNYVDGGWYPGFPGVPSGELSFAASWQGWFHADTDGTYSFGTASDDGSVLYLDLNGNGSFADSGEYIVNNNADQGETKKAATVSLTAGYYRIVIGYYQGTGGRIMRAKWQRGTQAAFDSLTSFVNGTNGAFFQTFTYTVGLSVTNTGATAPTPGTATFNASLQATGSVFDVWVYYGPANGTNNANAWGGSNLVATVTNVATDISKLVTGLPAGTVYYTYRIVNAATNFWASPSLSVVVQASASAPGITTQPEGGVNTNRATLNGFLSSTGSSETAVSVYWGPGDDQILTGAWAFTNDFGTCASLPPEGLTYATNVTGLLPGQPYTYRYYAVNATTGIWGAARSFTTWLPPTADDAGGATAVGTTNATLRGTVLVGNPNPQAWIYWGTLDGGTDKAAWNKPAVSNGVVAPGAFSATIAGLLANQTYWYRCYVSNACGESWSPASTNFTTAAPVLSIGNVSVPEGAQGSTTSAVLVVTLSATSSVPVSVAFTTASGPNAAAGTDYYSTNGTLTLPAGTVSASLAVTVVGNDFYQPDKTVFLDLTSPVSATLGNTQGVVTIANDDWTIYVRGDGLGSDTNSGAAWNSAWATLQGTLNAIPYYTQVVINVQASAGNQFYTPCSRQTGGYPTGRPLLVNLQGGWMNVDAAPTQGGMSVIQSIATNQHGIGIAGGYHGGSLTLTVNRFLITNVLHGISFITPASFDAAGCILTVSNTLIYARTNGINMDYPKPYWVGGAGGPTRVNAENVNIIAGLGGTGDGIYGYGAWLGSSVKATGIDPATGAQRVSTVRSANGCGVNFQAGYNGNGAHSIQFSNVVIYSCASNAMQLATGPSDPVQATLRNCTIADNGADGLLVSGGAAATWVSATNCIFAGNAGHGISLGTNGGPAFASIADYNVFFTDDIYTNGAVQAFGAHTATTDPLFYAQGTRPSPYYLLRSAASPAYRRGSDGRNMGAYQNDRIPGGTALLFR
jgi:hypothetical protein